MKDIKRLGILRKKIVEILEHDLPLAVIFDKYELTDEQIDFLYDFTKSIYKDDIEDNIEKDNTFIIPSSREYKTVNIKFLFLELEKFKTEKLTNNENKIKEEIIIRYLPIIKDTISLFFHNIELPVEDTLMFGINGLLYAIDNYKIKEECSFKKFAVENIVLSIKNNFKLLKGISFDEYINKENIENILVDIIIPAEEMSTTFDDYEQIDLIEDKKLSIFGTEYETEKIQDFKEMREIINFCMENYLDSRKMDIIKKSFGIDSVDKKTNKELAKEYNLSKVRLCSLYQSALYNLRNKAWILKKTYPEIAGKIYYRYYEEKTKIDVYSNVLNLLSAQVIESESVFIFLKMNGVELSKEELISIVKKIRAVCEIASKTPFDTQKVLSEIKYRNFHYYEPNCYEFENREDLIKYICRHYGVLSSATYNFLDSISMSEHERRKEAYKLRR